MMRDYFDDYGDIENRRLTVDRHMHRLNLASPESAAETATAAAATAKHNAWIEQHDGHFIPKGSTLAVSPTLAKQIGYRDEPVRFTAGDGGQRDD